MSHLHRQKIRQQRHARERAAPPGQSAPTAAKRPRAKRAR
jgi:hypothetical protein